MAVVPPLQEGINIGPYQIKRIVATGGQGNVYLAEDCRPRRASRHLRPAYVALKEAPYRILRIEKRMFGELSHPGLPRIYDLLAGPGYDLSSAPDIAYLVMEYIPGGVTLLSYQEKSPGYRLPRKEVLEIGIKIADILTYLHTRPRPIVHRDIKPNNILLNQLNEPILIDFGIARYVYHDAPVFPPKHILGTRGYLPDESFQGIITTKTDIYQVGIVLTCLASGQLLIGDSDFWLPQDRNPLDHLLLQMLAKDPEDRPTAAQVKATLQRFQSSWDFPGQVLHWMFH